MPMETFYMTLKVIKPNNPKRQEFIEKMIAAKLATDTNGVVLGGEEKDFFMRNDTTTIENRVGNRGRSIMAGNEVDYGEGHVERRCGSGNEEIL